MGRTATTPAAILLLLAANNVVRNVGLSMVNIAMPVHVREVLGMEYAAYGLLLGAFSIVNAVLEPAFAHLAQKHGYRRTIVTALGIFLAGTIACVLATSFWEMLVARLMQGAGSYYSAMFLLIDRTSTSEARARSFAVFMVSMTVGWIMGMVIGGILAEHLSMQTIFAIMAVLVAACMVSCLALPGKSAEAGVMQSTTGETNPSLPVADSWPGRGDYAKLVVINALRNLVFSAILSFLLFYVGIFLVRWGASVALSGALILPMVGAYIGFTLLGGSRKVLDKTGTRAPVVFSFLLLVPAFLLFGTFFEAMVTLQGLLVLLVFFGFTITTATGFGFPQSPVATRTMSLLPEKGRGALTGAYNTAGFLAHAVGPVLLSLIVDWEQGGNVLAAPHLSFIIAASLAGLAAMLAMLLKRAPH